MIGDDEFDETIHNKIKIGNNSGYLDQQYQIVKDFPPLSQYHFRIQDDTQILNLEILKKNSQPIMIENTFNGSSNQFKSKLDKLLYGLDSRKISFENSISSQKHGFYTLADSYDDQPLIKSMLDKIKVQQVRTKMESLSIKDMKPTFRKKQKLDDMKQQRKQIHKLSKNMNRITISQEDL